MSTPVDLRTHMVTAPPVRLFVALWGGLAVVDLARASGASTGVQIALLATLAALCSLGQPRRTALALGAVTWLVATGFVMNQFGELHLTGIGDLVRLALLAAVALFAGEVRR